MAKQLNPRSYVFDVDGTLTPSRSRMQERFRNWFSGWMDHVQSKGDRVILITGSDSVKTYEQLTDEIVNKSDYACFCMGNQITQKGPHSEHTIIHDHKFTPPEGLYDYLNKCLSESEYTERYGNHIEDRGSMINFSIVGRKAWGIQRTKYYEWDKNSGERISIAKYINENFDGIGAQVGGETGVDISTKGLDKSQIYTGDNEIIYGDCFFFGDRMDPDGNDYPLAKVLTDDIHRTARVFPVKDFYDTWNILLNVS
jgi:phosphomannomutase